MAINTRRLSGNVAVLYGTTVIGCAKTLKLDFKVDKLDSACQGSEGVNTAEPGNIGYTFSLSGIEKVYTAGDAASNISIDQMWADAIGGDSITLVYKGTEIGQPLETYVGYFESGTKNIDIANLSNYELSGWANSRTTGTVAS